MFFLKIQNFIKRIEYFFTVDVALAAIVFSVACVFGSFYFSSYVDTGGELITQKKEFGPAVMSACGKGLVRPVRIAEVGEFLHGDLFSITCDQIPENIPIRDDLGVVALSNRYLLQATALTWRLSGIVSWGALAPMAGILYGFALASSYGIFRLGMRRTLAILAVIALAVSPLHLTYLPHLRDYAKAPFILGLILVMSRIAIGPLKRKFIVPLSIAGGILQGLGLGFRPDLLINVPIFAAAVFLFSRGPIFARLKLKAAAFAIYVLVTAAISLPVLSTYSARQTITHAGMIGLFKQYSEALGVGNSLYSWGRGHDQYVRTLVNSYSARIDKSEDFLQIYSPDYSRKTTAYYFRVVSTFPADMLTRAFASILAVLKMPFSDLPEHPRIVPPPLGNAPDGLAHFQLADRFYRVWRSVWGCFAGTSLLIPVIGVLIVAGRSYRKGILLIAGIAYFAGYPAILFEPRHFFYLEIIGWWFLGFLLQQLVNSYRSRARFGLQRKRPQLLLRIRARRFTRNKRAIAFGLVCFLIGAGGSAGLRKYQQFRVGELLRRYADAYMEPAEVAATPLAENTCMLQVPELFPEVPDPHLPIETRYLVLEFDDDSPKISPEICYDPPYPVRDDPKLKKTLPLFKKSFKKVYLPVFQTPRRGESDTWRIFKGVNLPNGLCDNLTGVFIARGLEAEPFSMSIFLPEQWEKMAYCQALDPTWRHEAFDWEEVHPEGLCAEKFPYRLLPRGGVNFSKPDFITDEKTLPFMPDTVRIFSDTVRVVSETVVVKGTQPHRLSHLLEFGIADSPDSRYLSIKGRLARGAFTLVVLEPVYNKLIDQKFVDKPGPFEMKLHFPENEKYRLNLHNYGLSESDYEITVTGVSKEVEVFSNKAKIPRPSLEKKLKELIPGDDLKIVSGLGRIEKNRFIIEGRANRHPYEQVARIENIGIHEGQYFIVRGLLEKGGLSVGINTPNRKSWGDIVKLVKTGSFLIVVEVPPSGSHTIQFNNFLHGMPLNQESKIIIENYGWLR